MASQFDINAFRSTLKNDGARSNQFNVTIVAPVFAALNTRELSFMAEATQIPALSVGMIPVPYFGRQIKVAGDRRVDNWAITVVNADFTLRSAFERWNNSLAQMSTRAERQRVFGATSSPNSYVGQGILTQYGLEGEIVRSYKMTNLWPMEVSGIDLAWANNDQIERFGVTFAMDWFEALPVGPDPIPSIN